MEDQWAALLAFTTYFIMAFLFTDFSSEMRDVAKRVGST